MTDMDENSAAETDHSEQYLTYRIGSEDYGIKILSVREIRGWETVARVPNTPAYVKGVLNLRGTAVPVIDMRLRMKINAPIYDATTVLIVIRASIEGAERIAGVVVDSVSDVRDINVDEIKRTPDFADSVDTEFITGIADVGGSMVMLFDVDNFMRHKDLYDDPQALEQTSNHG